MKDIILTAVFGDETKQVILSSPHGGMNGYHIMIDNYYHGQVNKMLQGWIVSVNEKSWLSEEDKEVIIEAVKQAEKSPT
jgi:hypothetical protein